MLGLVLRVQCLGTQPHAAISAMLEERGGGWSVSMFETPAHECSTYVRQVASLVPFITVDIFCLPNAG